MYTNEIHEPAELVLDESLQFLMSTKLSNKAAVNDILLVLRSWWMNEIPYVNGKPARNVGADRSRLPVTQLACAADAFIKRDNEYIPLTKCDTVLTDKNHITYACQNITEEALAAVQQKLEDALVIGEYLRRKATTKEHIVRAYSKRFLIAALRDTSFKKGVYYTWEQFKNNAPVEREFSIKPNGKKEPPSLFVGDEAGNEILTRDVFAVSDGKKLYKVHHGFAFPIYRHNNAIYFGGLERFDLKMRGAPAGFPMGGGWYRGGLEPVTSVMKIRVTPHLLNLETGKEY